MCNFEGTGFSDLGFYKGYTTIKNIRNAGIFKLGAIIKNK